MNRRDFLKHASAAAAGLLVMPPVLRPAPNARRRGDAFSLQLLTDAPAQALAALQPFWAEAGLGVEEISYSEFALPGAHLADLVFVHGETLVDYTRETTPLAKTLARLAHALRLPRPVMDPKLLSFARDDWREAPRRARIFHRNELIETLDLQRPGEFLVRGSLGPLGITVAGGRVQIVEAACRHKTCQRLGEISRRGESLVCIPNRLRIVIDGRRENRVDAVTA